MPRGRGDDDTIESTDRVRAADEDVIPKWLMRMFSLGGASAQLPNGQLFGYGQRKVPCCFECNQRMSAHLEQPVRAAIADGVEAVRALDALTLTLWMAKLYYGSRFFETRFRTDVANLNSPQMLDHADLLGRNDYLRRLLLATPATLTVVTPPGTVFVFRAGVPSTEDTRFDFFVSAFAGVDLVTVRAGQTFIVAVFGDNGYWAQAFGGIQIVEHLLAATTLHPDQCTEISLWLASTAAGYETTGSWDVVTIAEPVGDKPEIASATPSPGGETATIFSSNFRVAPNGASPGDVQALRVNTFLTRLGYAPTPEELERATSGEFAPTLLINARTDEPVHATCFELRCPGLYRMAGWTTNLPTCSYCGAQSEHEQHPGTSK
ncbi:hypothetical protein EFK50_13205 [Nocardioides marmoriginsengisoli]|uniref:Uncharacterized protein n=1 Tax=Nocardioides marmoriginsengisoli TaxID=661483 RepID=A0A3N0CGW8_9ACTN|nr:hypothetical protein EFK50_13205 [Nocardioides marmoriginsengisoli]